MTVPIFKVDGCYPFRIRRALYAEMLGTMRVPARGLIQSTRILGEQLFIPVDRYQSVAWSPGEVLQVGI